MRNVTVCILLTSDQGHLPAMEADMAHASETKVDKIEHPQTYYSTPDALIRDEDISFEEKIKALNVWEQDARQMLAASNEGMPGSQEGTDPSDHNMLGQVGRAKIELGEKSARKLSH